MRAASIDAGQLLASNVLFVWREYDWLDYYVAGNDCEKREARNDSVWAVLDYWIFGRILLAE